MPPLHGIRTATLRPDVELSFDIYLLISGKHLLYVKRDDSIEEERLDRLKKKNVRQVFIEEADRKAYEDYLAVLKTAVQDETAPLDRRAAIVNGQAVAAVEEMFENPKPRENYEATRAAAASQVMLLMRHPEALEHMLGIAKFDRNIYQHSVNVAAISIGLAATLGANVEACNAVGIGALLHDVGKSPSATGGATADSSQHPRIGASLLLNKKYVSRDVLDVILLHEERVDGKGYPAGVKKLDQLFQVVGLANMYDRRVTIDGIDPKQAFDEIAAMKPAPYDARLITGLKQVLASNKIYT